jgi:hypothetical protein
MKGRGARTAARAAAAAARFATAAHSSACPAPLCGKAAAFQSIMAHSINYGTYITACRLHIYMCKHYNSGV